MARRTIVQLEDDIDGTKADETVTLGFDGATYELDLSDKNPRSSVTSWPPG